jgi:hypothetical protein
VAERICTLDRAPGRDRGLWTPPPLWTPPAPTRERRAPVRWCPDFLKRWAVISYGNTAVASGTTAAAVAAPSGVSDSDVMVCFKIDRATTGTTTAPTGWTWVASAAGTSGRIEVFWGVYGRNGIGAGTWSFAGTTRTLARITSYKGVNPSTPMDVTPSARYNASGTTGSTTITAVTDGNWVVGGFGTLTSGSYTWSAEAVATNPGSLGTDIESAYSTYLDLAVAHAVQTGTAGATGASSGTMSTAGNNACALVCLRPNIMPSDPYLYINPPIVPGGWDTRA